MNNLNHDSEVVNIIVEAAIAASEFVEGWRAFCGCEYLPEEASEEYRRGFVTAYRVGELDADPHGFNELLDALRSGQTQPIVRLTDEQAQLIEDERPGEEINLYPWAW